MYPIINLYRESMIQIPINKKNESPPKIEHFEPTPNYNHLNMKNR